MKNLLALTLALLLAVTAPGWGATITPTSLTQTDLVALLQNIVDTLGTNVGSTYLTPGTPKSITGALTLDSTLGVTGAAKFSSEVAIGGGTTGKNLLVYDGTGDAGGVIRLLSGGSVSTGMLDFINGTGVVGEFLPCLRGVSNTSRSGYPGLWIQGKPGADNANNPAIKLLGISLAGSALTASDVLQVYNGASTCVARINASGNVTLGATDLASTTSKLYVDGVVKVYSGNGNWSYIGHANSGTFPKASVLSLGSDAVTNAYSSGGGTLTATGSAQIAAIQSASAGATTDLAFYTTSGGSVTEGMRIDSAQEIFFPGLGTTTATAANVVLEGSPLQLKTVSSLRHLKTDIKPIGIDWSSFMKLNPVSFKQKSDPTGPTIFGFIAEEIEKVYRPLAVYADGKLQSVAYDRVGAVNTAAIQDLKRENDELKARIDRLEKLVEKLESRK